LLGIAFHPEFGQAGKAGRGYVYLYYCYRPAGQTYGPYSYNRLSRFTLADGATAISRSSELVLINQFDRKTWHNGGDLFFDNDGYLYISNGDEGDGIPGAEFSNSQKINDGLFSGVLRIDVDMIASRSHPIRRQPRSPATPPAGWPASYTQNYFIPNDNPWVNADGSALEEFYAIGLRSPHRMGYDRVTDKALIADTGHDVMEEVDVLARGANYQWPYMEGTATGPQTYRRGPGVETPPIHTYSSRVKDGSVSIGGEVYRGANHAADLDGKYIFGDFMSGNVWALDWQATGAPRRHLLTVPAGVNYRGLSGFGTDAEGEIYMCVLGEQGRIFKLVTTGTGAQPPATLSQTGAFTSYAPNMQAAAGLVSYRVNSQLWSDGARKRRWIALPNNGAPYTADEVVRFSESGEWGFPVGTVLVKHFDMGTSDLDTTLRKKIETRFTVRTATGWYGVTYRWRDDGQEADLLPGGASMNISIAQANGATRVQRWDFPAREDCMTCHNTNAGFALGVNTRQLNGSRNYAGDVTANQLVTWSAIGMFDTTLSSAQINSFAVTVDIADTSASLEARVRSYLDANCSHCHRPEGVWRANMDARFTTPLAQQNIVNGTLVNDFAIPGMKEIAPGDILKSMMHLRMTAENHVQMPPLGRNVVDTQAVAVLEQWIASLAGSNRAPQIIAPANQSSQRGSSVSLQISASDPDGNALTYSATGLPAGLVINPGTGLITGVIASNAFTAQSVTVTVRDASLNASATFNWAVTESTSGGIFTSADIGSVSSTGSLVYNSGTATYTVRGSGADIYNTADAFHFASRALVGDGEIRARVTSQTNTAPWAKAGVMIRESSATGSRHAMMFTTPVESGNGYEFIWRAATNGSTAYAPGPVINLTPNNWLRLTRSGDVIAGYASTNGVNWTFVKTISLTGMPGSLNAGIAVSSVNNGLTGTATFDNVAITPFPLPWQSQNVGTPPFNSRSESTGSVFTIISGGLLGGVSDSCRYVSQTLTGDGEIRLRVNSQSPGTNSQTLVMIRDSLSAGSPMAAVSVKGTSGEYAFLRRFSSGGATTTSISAATSPARWVRIVRTGGTFTAYKSYDGIAWFDIGSSNIAMGASIRIGFAAVSGFNTSTNTAFVDNVVCIP
jgi:uncharacterized repeat protein (TIGR03806 family)